MAGKTGNMIRTDLRLDLKDSGSLWSDAELNRSYEKAVSDFSRFLPLEKAYEVTLDFTITNESFTTPATTNLTAICSAVDINVAAGSTLTISGQPDVPRPLTLTITDANSSTYGATFTIRGTDKDGLALTEQFHYNRGMSKTLTGKKEFKTVYEVELESDSGSGAGDTLSVGYGTAYTAWIYLAYRPIDESAHETVTNAAGTTTYARDTDYTMDYYNGRIKLLSGGSMAASTAYLIDYKKDNISIDLSSLPDMVRVMRVEYPVGDVPQSFVPTDSFSNNKVLYITGLSGDQESQSIMSEKYHARVFYGAEHQPAIDDAAGTVPDFLDNTIVMASVAYALFIYAEKQEHQAATDLASARTALGSVTVAQTAIDTAFTNMKKYLDNNSTSDAESMLSSAIAVFTSVGTALTNASKYLDNNGGADATGMMSAMSTDLTAFDTALTNVKKYLDNNTANDAAGMITAIATLHTAVGTAITSATKWLDNNSGTDAAGTLAAMSADLTAFDTALTAATTQLSTNAAGAAGNAAIGTAHTAIGTALGKITTYLENNTNNDAKTMLSSMSTDLTTLDTAIADVTTVLDNNSGADAKELLKDITDDAANLRTSIEVAVDAIATALAAVVSTDISSSNAAGASMDEPAVLAQTALTAGTALHNTVNVGGEQQEVPLAYAKDAEMQLGVSQAYGNQQAGYLQTATARTNAAMGYMQEAAQRLSNLRSYIEQSAGYVNIGNAFISQAIAIKEKLSIYIDKTSRYVDMASGFANNATVLVNEINQYLQQGSVYADIGEKFVSEANAIVTKLQAYNTKSNQYQGIASNFINEATVKVGEIAQYVAQADAYTALATQFNQTAANIVNKLNIYIAKGNSYIQVAGGFLTEAQQYMNEVTAYISSAQGYIAIANAFAGEAEARIGQISSYISQAQRYIEASDADMLLADKFKSEAQDKRDEVWSIWRDKNQFIGDSATSSVRQSAAFTNS